MTSLEKPLSRVVSVFGQAVIVTLVPGDGPVGPHVTFRLKGQHKPYRSLYIELPAEEK